MVSSRALSSALASAAGKAENACVILDTGPYQVREQALDERPAFLVAEQLEEFLRKLGCADLVREPERDREETRIHQLMNLRPDLTMSPQHE